MSKTPHSEQTARTQEPPSQAARFSLHRLSEAFARLTGQTSTNAPIQGSSDASDRGQSDEGVVELSRQVLSPRMIVEGILFVGDRDNRPLSSRMIAAQIRDVSPQEIDSLIVELNEGYDRCRCCYHVVSEGAGYRLQIRPEFQALGHRLLGHDKQIRLSHQAIEVLSVVAYQQPIAADEVSRVRGARSNPLLNQLVRRGLLQLDRSTDSQANPVYRTTDRFNRLLGIRSPDELPQSEDLDDN